MYATPTPTSEARLYVTNEPAVAGPGRDAGPAVRRGRMAIPLFAGAVFVNAFLLFLLQPMFGKMALPHLGGSAAVWTTCMLFFETGLLVGYLYAHVLASRFATRTQVWTHSMLLPGALVSLAL